MKRDFKENVHIFMLAMILFDIEDEDDTTEPMFHIAKKAYDDYRMRWRQHKRVLVMCKDVEQPRRPLIIFEPQLN